MSVTEDNSQQWQQQSQSPQPQTQRTESNEKHELGNKSEPSHDIDMESQSESSTCVRKSNTIKAIDKTSVHRICSGQVVLTLGTAVKELVENSIDAGALSVEVKLKDYGCECIEVIDNGCGVEEKNFEGLTLKHHTSKLQDFDDLTSVSTFGFRGEALSSLCALGNMVITTRHKDTQVGSRLEFNLSGKLVSKRVMPRQVGTTVTVQNLFHTLPVRHREFQRNIKKEFAKLVQILNAYCIINTGVRISCSNQTAKGNRSSVVATNGNASLKENIANVFSPKQLKSLLEFQQVEAQEEICGEYGIKPNQKSSVHVSIEGFLSKCEHGQGRSSSDRQFIFINKRPCDSTKILKVINEVYHSYNRHQNPFIALSITMDQNSVDVNVTPDKRQIFVEGEKVLLAVIKSSLIHIFEPTVSVFRMNNILSQPNDNSTPSLHLSPDLLKSDLHQGRSFSTPESKSNNSNTPSLSNSLSKLKRSFSSAFDKGTSETPSPVSASSALKKKPFGLSSRGYTVPSYPPSSTSDKSSITHFFNQVSSKSSKLSEKQCQKDPEEVSCEVQRDDLTIPILSLSQGSGKENFKSSANSDMVDTDSQEILVKKCGVEDDGVEDLSREPCLCSHVSSTNVDDSNFHSTSNSDVCSTVSPICESVPFTVEEINLIENSEERLKPEVSIQGQGEEPLPTQEQAQLTDLDFDDSRKDVKRKEVSVKFTLSAIKDKIRLQKSKDSFASKSSSRSFRSKICPDDNQSAESELQKEISKDMFSQMEILGQFNLGFIITKLGNDLFIVDQHATDEKYNFEMLQKNTVLQSQKLIVPQNLELTASNETILVDNMDIFKKNGFDFCIDTEAPPTQRVKLVSAPVSKNWNFGKEDIEELLFMLRDSPNTMCRPSRIRLMFASRSCRKAIMIGTALKTSEMQRVVRHMGEIEQPWNCPHGRPTMRHLFNLQMLPS